MPAKLFLYPSEGWLGTPPATRLFVTAARGLSRVKSGRVSGFLEPASELTALLSRPLGDALATWRAEYDAFEARLPDGEAPQNCRDFPLQEWNARGWELAQQIAADLEEGWSILFKAVEASGMLRYSSYVIEAAALHRTEPVQRWGDGTAICVKADEEQRCPCSTGRWVRIGAIRYHTGVADLAGESWLIGDLPIAAKVAERLQLGLERCIADLEDIAMDSCAERRSDYDAELTRVMAESRRIAEIIRTLLPDDWTVVFYDAEQAERRALRSAFEYRL